jgi:hypothetical protein
MAENESLLERPRLKKEGGRLVALVPWHDAERLQAHLRKQGIGSTLLIDAWEHQARLEIWPGAAAGQVWAILDQWKG